MASGVLQTARPIGVTIGVTILGLAVPGRVDTAAFGAVAGIGAAIAAAAAVVSVTMIRPGTPAAPSPVQGGLSPRGTPHADRA